MTHQSNNNDSLQLTSRAFEFQCQHPIGPGVPIDQPTGDHRSGSIPFFVDNANRCPEHNGMLNNSLLRRYRTYN